MSDKQACISADGSVEFIDIGYQAALIDEAPRTFYIYAGLIFPVLLGLALWARRRPILPSVAALTIYFFAALLTGVADTSPANWHTQHVLMALTLLTCLVGAANGIRHGRD